MNFNSLHFVVFFILVYFLYYSVRHKYRWILLLIASYYFYMCWNPAYLGLIVLSTLVDYLAGLYMGKTDSKKKRKLLLASSLTSNLGILFLFKYFNFFSATLTGIFGYFQTGVEFSTLNLLLPVGISFYTFQTLSYTIDVYRGHKEPETHLGLFAVYVCFFPQLVAGPIERSTNLLPQFHKEMEFDYERVSDGLKLVLWGFFKKIVIADNVSLIVDSVYSNAAGSQGLPSLIGTLLFGVQIYCDFSAYSDIAIGTSSILGFKLMKNFNRPYHAHSLTDFWRRWHISLSTWFKDYVYIPLGGNRCSRGRQSFNLFAVFLISGLWHGASWNFVIWGGIHGVLMVAENLTRNLRKRLFHTVPSTVVKGAGLVYTFSIVHLAWIFFRASDLKEALFILKGIFSHPESYFTFQGLQESFMLLNAHYSSLVIILLSLIVMEGVHLLQKGASMKQWLGKRRQPVRLALYSVLLTWIFVWGEYGVEEFIYFQF